MYFIEFCNKTQSSQQIIIFAVNCKSFFDSFLTAFCLSTDQLNERTVRGKSCQVLQLLTELSAIFARSSSAVPKPLLHDVSRPILFLLFDDWRQSSNKRKIFQIWSVLAGSGISLYCTFLTNQEEQFKKLVTRSLPFLAPIDLPYIVCCNSPPLIILC